MLTSFTPSVWVFWAISLSVGLIGLGGMWLLARWSPKWAFVAFAAVLVIVFEFVFPAVFRNLKVDSLSNAPAFVREYFWTVTLVLTLGTLTTVIFLVRAIVASRPAEKGDRVAVEAEARYPDIDSAWHEILVRLGQARIDPAGQRVVLLLAPREEDSEAVVASAGLQVFAQAPEVSAPIHAYSTAEGLLIGCAGASALGLQEAVGSARLEYLCRLILRLDPDCPAVRSVVVVMPLGWAGQAESIRWAAAVRDDLRTIERVLQVNCPVFAVFSELETAPGVPEFLARMNPALRQGRCGFAVPPSHAFSGDLAQRGLAWMSKWFQGWTLSLMIEDLNNPAGNAQLFTLGGEFRRYRKRLRAILEAAFSTMHVTDPVQFRGCYFVATGPEPADQSFSAGLFRGPRGRVMAEHIAARWTEQARLDDDSYRRSALGVGLVGIGVASLGWFVILSYTGKPLWAIGLMLVVAAWGVTIYKLARK